MVKHNLIERCLGSRAYLENSKIRAIFPKTSSNGYKYGTASEYLFPCHYTAFRDAYWDAYSLYPGEGISIVIDDQEGGGYTASKSMIGFWKLKNIPFISDTIAQEEDVEHTYYQDVCNVPYIRVKIKATLISTTTNWPPDDPNRIYPTSYPWYMSSRYNGILPMIEYKTSLMGITDPLENRPYSLTEMNALPMEEVSNVIYKFANRPCTYNVFYLDYDAWEYMDESIVSNDTEAEVEFNGYIKIDMLKKHYGFLLKTDPLDSNFRIEANMRFYFDTPYSVLQI